MAQKSPLSVDLFLDSGAHSLYTKEVIQLGHADGYAYYDTPDFMKYVDNYAQFVKENLDYIEVYVNVDVIFNSDRSWDIYEYLKNKHGLNPLPVIHFGTDPKWITKYVDDGCEYIGLGGLGQEVNKAEYLEWGDLCWDQFLTDSKGYPIVKVHGFAMTALDLMIRWPWYSVDSTSWVMTSRFGSIYVPREVNGEYVYGKNTWKIGMSTRSPGGINKEVKFSERGDLPENGSNPFVTSYEGNLNVSKKDSLQGSKHYSALTSMEKTQIDKYLMLKGFKVGLSTFRTESKNYPLEDNERWFGRIDDDGSVFDQFGNLISYDDGNETKDRYVETIVEVGLSNDYKLRDELNIIYFKDLENFLPKWPWSWKRKTAPRFGMRRL